MRNPRLCAAVSLILGISLSNAVTAQETIKLGERRIVGGEKTNIKEHPWQVALKVKLSKGTFLCGGSIIAEKWALTAAHCFDPDTPPGAVRAKAGATDYVADGSWSDIERLIVHPDYNPETHENDIALIEFQASPSGRVIPLAEAHTEIAIGQPLEVTGWGATAEEGRASRELLKATVPYVATGTCNGPGSYAGEIKSGMMCAGEKEGGVDSCQGDSGGPLVWNTADGPVLVGVVSFGEGCARQLKYGVYTRVSSYVDWINSVIAANR
jgi:secreted trypsin-like serine protease